MRVLGLGPPPRRRLPSGVGIKEVMRLRRAPMSVPRFVHQQLHLAASAHLICAPMLLFGKPATANQCAKVVGTLLGVPVCCVDALPAKHLSLQLSVPRHVSNVPLTVLSTSLQAPKFGIFHVQCSHLLHRVGELLPGLGLLVELGPDAVAPGHGLRGRHPCDLKRAEEHDRQRLGSWPARSLQHLRTDSLRHDLCLVAWPHRRQCQLLSR